MGHSLFFLSTKIVYKWQYANIGFNLWFATTHGVVKIVEFQHWASLHQMLTEGILSCTAGQAINTEADVQTLDVNTLVLWQSYC